MSNSTDIREIISNLYEGASTDINDEVIVVTYGDRTVTIDGNLPLKDILNKLKVLL